MLGRIPVESAIAERCPHWRHLGFKANGHVLCAATWVDNLFSASQSLHGALSILDDFEKQLQAKWELTIKPTSRSCMAAAGNLEPQPPPKWPQAETFSLLGHTLQHNGSIRACWRDTRRAMWRSFWANPASRDGQNLSRNAKLQLLSKAVLPQLEFRCSRWPPQKTVARELDDMQRKMYATIARIPRHPAEATDQYVRRRGREAATACRLAGTWSSRWFKRACKWNEHLERPRNSVNWSAKLLHYHDRAWFIQKRASLLPSNPRIGSCLAGRTDTRADRGGVCRRWHDGIAFARGLA